MKSGKQILVWIKRFRHRRGYGVHSPFAFNFITGVVYEKGRYYSYPFLSKERRKLGKKSKIYPLRVDKLLFRVSNFIQPDVILYVGNNFSDSILYMSAGCKKSELCILEESDFSKFKEILLQYRNKRLLLHIGKTKFCSEIFFQALPLMDKESCVVIDDIYKEDYRQDFWKILKENPSVILTFDLYDLGVVLCDNKLNKQNYTVNF